MALATWWRGDALPSLTQVPGFHAEASRDEPLIASVTGLNAEQCGSASYKATNPF